MAKVDAFLEALVNYDKENIHPEVTKAIQPYLKDSEFEPDFIRQLKQFYMTPFHRCQHYFSRIIRHFRELTVNSCEII